MFNLAIAYLLWIFGGFGVLGLHRFYMRKIGTGALWLCTGGLGFVGALYDLVTMPQQIREANYQYRYRLAEWDAFDEEDYEEKKYSGSASSSLAQSEPVMPLEKVILKTAKENKGKVSAAEVSLNSNVSLDEAREALEEMAAKGYAEMKVMDNGSIAYYFPDFMSGSRETAI